MKYRRCVVVVRVITFTPNSSPNQPPVATTKEYELPLSWMFVHLPPAASTSMYKGVDREVRRTQAAQCSQSVMYIYLRHLGRRGIMTYIYGKVRRVR